MCMLRQAPVFYVYHVYVDITWIYISHCCAAVSALYIHIAKIADKIRDFYCLLFDVTFIFKGFNSLNISLRQIANNLNLNVCRQYIKDPP